jgi:hypothetical protein
MCRVLKVEIRETQDELQELLRQQKTGLGKERVQALYLLKTRQVETVQHLAVVLGRGRITVQRWLRLYRDGGLRDLQKIKCPALSNIFRLNPRTGGRCAPRRNARAGHFIIWKCLNRLLEQKKSPGRPKSIPLDVRSLIKKELSQPEGFKSYEEVRTWLLAVEGIEASYKVVHEVVRYKLKAKLKAARPL